MSLRDKIKNAKDCPLFKVIVPEWDNAEVYVRTISGAQRARFEERAVKGKDAILSLLALSLCEADGTPIWREDDIADLGEKSLRVLLFLFNHVRKVNKLDAESLDDAEGESVASR